MATEEGRHNDFSRGINNTMPGNQMPEGFVRDALNLEPHGNSLSLRAGYEKVLPGENIRGVAALESRLVFVDGDELKIYDLSTREQATVATVPAKGAFVSTVFNNELFFQVGAHRYRYDGHELRRWGVPDVLAQPGVTAHNPTTEDHGDRQVAMTWVNERGEEGGTVRPALVPSGNFYEVQVPEREGMTARIYMSPVAGNTLYWQADFTQPGTYPISNPRDDTAPLETVGMRAPPVGHLMDTRGGFICIAQGSYVFFTEPFKPHLVDMRQNFLQYPERIGMMLSGRSGVYISADECYVVRGVETPQVEQQPVLNYPAVEGSGTITEDGRAAWVTQHGLAIEGEEGAIEEPNRGVFSPREAEEGTMGYVNNGGRQMLVASMKGRKGGTGQLAAGDFFEAEVVKK